MNIGHLEGKTKQHQEILSRRHLLQRALSFSFLKWKKKS